MLDLRSPLIWGAPLAGLIAGAAVWLVSGGPTGVTKPLAALTEQANTLAPPAPANRTPGATSLAALTARPLFLEGAAIARPTVNLIGVVRRPGRTAALMSFGGAEPRWVNEGETVGGLTLVQVRSSGVQLDSLSGPLVVGLGETADGATSPEPDQSPDSSAPPAGVRLPPEPANAPRTP